MTSRRAIPLFTLAVVGILAGFTFVGVHAQESGLGSPGLLPAPIVFVSRPAQEEGTIYWDEPYDMPGVGPHSRFRVAAPGKLVILTPGGDLRTLVDGSNPQPQSLNLIDVNAPDVSYDGKRIVFAGFQAGDFTPGVADRPASSANGWRLYVINVDGTGLKQITFPGPNLDLSQFGEAAAHLGGSDDTDPVWLPDGRIIFASTRWPSLAHYSGVRTSNLYVMNEDGSALHRITAEKNGAERPLVDPRTGQVVYARWWRNHRFAVDDMSTITAPGGGYIQKDGLTENRDNHVGGANFLFRNQWHAAVIRPDGTGLGMWSGIHHLADASHYYGGSFRPDGNLVGNYFPMANMTEASGFGGLRLFPRDSNYYQGIVGVTTIIGKQELNRQPISFGVTAGPYYAEPEVLPDNRIVVSRALDITQDYGLFLINADGGGLRLLYDNPKTSEVRARLVQSRPVPPILADTVAPVDAALPPREGQRYDIDGTFVFDALNVYGNGPVDTIPMSAPPIGSADKIRFFLDQQRTSPGSFSRLDWPILLGEIRISADGKVRDPAAPANLPLFEQIRSKDGTVPLTPGGLGGATHVAGMNFGRPGQVARCIGCHPGHTTIPVPENDEDALWSNLAPGAAIRVSTSRSPAQNGALIDRKVMNGATSDYWSSALGQSQGQWVELVFPEPVTVRTVRLYNPRNGGDAFSSVQVAAATVHLFRADGVAVPSASRSVGELSVSGTGVDFPDVPAQVVRVNIDSVSGLFFSQAVAALAEIEVISRGREPDPLPGRSRSVQR